MLTEDKSLTFPLQAAFVIPCLSLVISGKNVKLTEFMQTAPIGKMLHFLPMLSEPGTGQIRTFLTAIVWR